MGKPEAEVENYLVERIEFIGGLTRKLQWTGRDSAPDRFIAYKGRVVLVETKAKGEPLRKKQELEIGRLREQGVDVWVIDTRDGVDILTEALLNA